ncbi:nuclear cap-binding protein subunit 1-like [Brevipalpus obovatus]|uniref:nuclear cap-binding protein subunit 1-like n=1 Tax=Brevipalpus obovatus TaxID=246614 RepID=UPI003D9F9167
MENTPHTSPLDIHVVSLKKRNDDLGDNLEHLIVRLGEKSTSSLEKNLEELVDILDHDVSKSAKSGIIKIICECVAEIPEKTSIYATLVGLLNNRNYDLGANVIELLSKGFKESLKNCEWTKSHSFVRFFADLVNCHVISPASLMNFFETLTDVTMEDNIPQVRSDFFSYIVLSSLPWVGYELYDKKEQDLEQSLNTIENYIAKRSRTHHTPLRVWYSDTPHPQEEYLGCLWAQISKLRSDKWAERHIYRPYLSFGKVLCEGLQHNLPNITIPPHAPSNTYPYPRVVFRLFDYTDCPDSPILPGAHSIERYLVEENVKWIIDSNYLYYYVKEWLVQASSMTNANERIY